MTQHQMPPDTPQPVALTYDDYIPTKDRRSRTLFIDFWLGTFCVPFVSGILLTVFLLRGKDPFVVAVFDGFVLCIGFAFLALLPTTLALGLTIWLRLKILREVRFAPFHTAFLSGVVGGLYPFIPFNIVPLSDNAQLVIFYGGLAWRIVVPIAAGFWLCRRSALRD